MAKQPIKAAAKTVTLTADTPPKRGWLLPTLITVLGIASGAGAATAYFLFLHPHTAEASPETANTLHGGVMGAAMDDVGDDKAEPPAFIKIERMTVPMVAADGHLVSYMSMELVLQAKTADVDYIKLRLPIIRNAINEALTTQSVVDGHDIHKIDYTKTAALLKAAANKALGKSMIDQAEVITAMPI